jgi:hypothetical protein
VWNYQLSDKAVLDLPGVNLYAIDVFDNAASVFSGLRRRGIKSVCYFSAGTFENWRPDKGKFPASVIGNPLGDWPGESWFVDWKRSREAIDC